MAQLWTELSNQQKLSDEQLAQINNTSINNNIVAPQLLNRNSETRRAAVICPVNNNFDFASNRNGVLFKERFESAWNFDQVIVEESARSSQAKPSAAIVAVLVPALEQLLLAPASPLDLLVVYITCSTAVDIAEIYDNVAAAILGAGGEDDSNSPTAPQPPRHAMIIVDSPCVAPLQVAPGAQLPIPLLVPRADFDGHIALKFLHAAHDCGDDNSPVTLDAVASRITPIATLMGAGTESTRFPWNPFAAPSSQLVTFLVSSSIEPLDAETLRAIDGRNVGKALKAQMQGARLRFLVEKDQSVILNFNAEDTLRPPEVVLHHEDCAAEFEAALAGVGVFSARLGNVMPSMDRRFVASLSASPPASTLQSESLKLFKVVSDQSIRLQVSHRIPSKTFIATNMALAFKYEATATYRTYLLLEALVRLHTASPEHRLRIEDLTACKISGEGVNAGNFGSFMFIRGGVSASAAGVSPRRQMFVSTSSKNNSPSSSSTARNLNQQQQNNSMLNVSAASPAQQQQQQQQSVVMNSNNNINAVNIDQIVSQVLSVTRQEQEQSVRNAVREEIQQSVPQIVREQVEHSNMQMAAQFQEALEQMRAEFSMELRRTSDQLSGDIRETESRWKKHLLLIENRLQRVEQDCEELKHQQQNQNSSSSVPRNNNTNNNLSPLAMRKEIAAAVDSLGTPIQHLDQKVATLSSNLDSTNERLLALEQLVSTTTRNLSSSQDNWMNQRDAQLQQFSTNLTQTLEQRLSNFVTEGRMKIVEERFDEFVANNNNANTKNNNNDTTAVTASSPSPSRALTERMTSIESTAEQAKRDCATLEQKLTFLEDSTKRLISNSESTIKSDLSTSVNRFSSDLSQRLVAYLNDSITRINNELNAIKLQVNSQSNNNNNGSTTASINLIKDEFSDVTNLLEANVKKSTSDIRDLRSRVQQLEVGQQSGVQSLTEQDKSKNQRITALEEQVGRLTNFIRNM